MRLRSQYSSVYLTSSAFEEAPETVAVRFLTVIAALARHGDVLLSEHPPVHEGIPQEM